VLSTFGFEAVRKREGREGRRESTREKDEKRNSQFSQQQQQQKQQRAGRTGKRLANVIKEESDEGKQKKQESNTILNEKTTRSGWTVHIPTFFSSHGSQNLTTRRYLMSDGKARGSN